MIDVIKVSDILTQNPNCTDEEFLTAIGDQIDEWHRIGAAREHLHESLGLSRDEHDLYVERPSFFVRVMRCKRDLHEPLSPRALDHGLKVARRIANEELDE